MAEVDRHLLEQFSRDRALASNVLFAHRHPQESAPAHIEVMDLWRSADEFVLIEAHREFGKSTLSEEFLVLEGCFGNFNYCLLIGETYMKACQRLYAIDFEARTNTKLHHLFGGPVLRRKSIENKVFFRSGAIIEALGWEQELQSFKEGTHRPDRAYLDDPENQERVRDKAAVDASMRKLYLELIPALDKNRRKIRITQTRRAEDCMVTRLAGSEEWIYRAYPICNGDPQDPEATSLWPARYPMDWIRKEESRYRTAGMLSEFRQAYLLQASNPEAKPFKDENISEISVSAYDWAPRVVIYDPSRSSNERRTKTKDRSDRTGKVVVSRVGSKLLVHESGGHFWKPDELIADLFATQEKHNPAKTAIEKNSLDDWLLQPIRLEMLRRRMVLPLEMLQAPQDRSKEQFIMGLQPFAVAGDIILVGGRLAHPDLVAEWKNFPQGSRDVMNALAYALKVFGGTPVYEDFSGANLSDAPQPRGGDTVYLGVNAGVAEVAAVAVLRLGRRLHVARDWTMSGSVQEAVRSLMYEVRATFPQCTMSVWVPADTYDQWQRIPLVPALRSERVTPYRSDFPAVSRGTLADRMRMVWNGQRLLMVDRRATNTMNALALGYSMDTTRAREPDPGISRLTAEALETMVRSIDGQDEAMELPAGANLQRNANGRLYVSANPGRG